MRVIVCGGRDYHEVSWITHTLDRIHAKKPITLLIEGGARGVDAHAATWANAKGIPRVSVPANWAYFGNSAGYVRNAVMVTLLAPDLVIAFPGGKGTNNMVAIAQRHNIKIIDVRDKV